MKVFGKLSTHSFRELESKVQRQRRKADPSTNLFSAVPVV